MNAGGKGRDGLVFKQLKPEQLREGRSRLGLREWEDTAST